MADEASKASGNSILSTFDKLKLSCGTNSYSINKPSTRSSLIDKTSQSTVDVTSAAAAVSFSPAVVALETGNSFMYEKSIDSPQLPQTVMMFGSGERNTSFTKNGGTSAYGKRSASGCSQFPPQSQSPSSPVMYEKTMHNLCESTTDSVTSPLSQSFNVSSSNSSLSHPSISSVEMLLPKSSANNKAGNFEMFSTPSSSLNKKMVQRKSNQFDTNEIPIKMSKSSKCKLSTAAIDVATNSTHTLAVQVNIKKCSSLNNICAPPPKVPPYNNKIGNSKKSNSKLKNTNVGLPLLPARLDTNSLDYKKEMQSTRETTDERNKKKRCSDRYDSSESSDSGVATSLSCTDSSTASSDVSDPGSPYSTASLGDELVQKSIIMPPQTILATTNGNAGKSPTTSAATPVQNVLKGSKQQQKQSQNKNQQQPKLTKSQPSSPLHKLNQHIWPWTTQNGGVGTRTNIISEMGSSSSPKNNFLTLNNNKNSNKRHSQTSSTPIDGGAKKTRTLNGNSKDNSMAAGGVNANGNASQPPQIVSNNKRLKAAAMEESQTKITGYFKSQMKAQIHQSGLKKDSTLSHILPSSSAISTLSPSVTVTAVVSSSSFSSINTAPAVKTTSCSLNKYFSLLNSQMREEQERTAATAMNASTKLPSLPPALKKIERSKPTKIAQVAPNLRKTTAAPPLSHFTDKSPKKHVAIAPRTAESRQRHEQSVPSPLKAPITPAQQQQPAVLLTAIHIPQSNQPPQLVPTSPQQQQMTVGKTQSNNNTSQSSKIPTGPSLYQIPMMPNLVQIPNLIAANVSQLTDARGNHHHHPGASAQYILNGTVFKLHQYTHSPPATGTPIATLSSDTGNQSINTATMTNSAIATDQQQHASNNKNTSSITATSLQEMFSNQFHTQQQQQSASAHNHRLHNSQPIFMATTTGLLLNATSLPAMMAGTGKHAVAIQPQQIPALQPIQGAVMPGLSSIFSPHQQQQMQQYKSEQIAPLDPQIPLLQQQTNIPPLAVPSSAFSKLAIVKAGNASFTSSIHQVSATQPPPLVTISSGNPIVSSCGSKSHVSAKPYELNGGQQESIAKAKRTVSENANTKKAWLDSTPLILAAPSVLAPLKSPPALIYPSLTTKKEEQHTNEDIFDILKNSKNETTLTPPSSTRNQSNEEICQGEQEENDITHTVCMESSSLLSAENTSNTTISEESIKDSPPSLPEYSITSSSLISAESPRLEIDQKTEESETSVNIKETSSADTFSIISKLSPTVDIALADNDCLPKCAISPILSQPKTIRFPAKHESGHRYGPKGMRRHDGVCYWDKCNKKHDSNSKLLDHMQTHHVNTQTGPFACLWLGCKVYGRESCSRRWLERHVLSHGGTKPFKCIVDGCGLRFGSQLALQKHVNGHFTATENKDSTNKRTSDPPVPKLLRKNGKKLRYRRQPFSARMFDFFDARIMEGLHHRLRQISTLTNGKNCITFRGQITMRRKNPNGICECFVEWAPPNIIANEWLPESNIPYIKTLPINRMQPREKTNIESLLRSAYRLPHSPNLFQSFHSLSRQNSQDSTSTYNYSQSSSTPSEDTADDTSRSSSFGLSSISNLPLKFPQIELRQKQSRKQPKTIQPS